MIERGPEEHRVLALTDFVKCRSGAGWLMQGAKTEFPAFRVPVVSETNNKITLNIGKQ